VIISDVVKLCVLPTIVALATEPNARDKAAAMYEARILMSYLHRREWPMTNCDLRVARRRRLFIVLHE
jgi:hypothetical protein